MKLVPVLTELPKPVKWPVAQHEPESFQAATTLASSATIVVALWVSCAVASAPGLLTAPGVDAPRHAFGEELRRSGRRRERGIAVERRSGAWIGVADAGAIACRAGLGYACH